MRSKLVKGILTVVGAVLLSTLGIYAADSLEGVRGSIGSQLIGGKKDGVCMEGSVPVTIDGKILCADMYEASPSSACPNQNPTNTVRTEENANTKDCYAASVGGKAPWTFVSLTQAQRLCANAGKRLPTSAEWYHIALGTTAQSCVISKSGVAQTGTATCVSGVGAFDLVGNVWEWVDEQVVGNTYQNRPLPPDGYVTSVDASGVAITAGGDPDDLYGKDYVWSGTEGVFGMIRGGFYGSNDDAGLYTVNAKVPTNFATQGVGFRCVKDNY